MRKYKLYIETSIVNHLFADDVPEKMSDTITLWDDLKSGKFEVFLSDTVFEELDKCAEPKRTNMMNKLSELEYATIKTNPEILDLAEQYIEHGILTRKSYLDCVHIASAAFANCDFVASWNFRHLVNYRTIDGARIVNTLLGYKVLGIITPTMLRTEGGGAYGK